MRVAILSDSPALPTGFARTSRFLADCLVSLDHEVVFYGIGSWGETFDRRSYPYVVWAAGFHDDDHAQRLRLFLEHVRPDVLILNYDLLSVTVWLRLLRTLTHSSRVIAHVVVDGLPVYGRYLRALSSVDAVVVPTQCVATYLRQYVSVPVSVIPHAVDMSEFAPFPDARAEHRSSLPFDRILGVIAQNRPRKQLTQVLQALRILVDGDRGWGLILHTDRADTSDVGGTDLVTIVKTLALEGHVVLTSTSDLVDVLDSSMAHNVKVVASVNVSRTWPSLTVAERINVADVIAVPSSHGGFEYSIVEGQACGVPVCATSDDGVLSEVGGGATLPLKPALFDILPYGARAFRIAPATIAEAAQHLASRGPERDALVRAGLQNASLYERTRVASLCSEVLTSLLS